MLPDAKAAQSTERTRSLLVKEWEEPLAAAAALGANKGRKATMVTAWTRLPGDAARYQDEAYSLHIHDSIAGEMPGLLPLLRDAGAQVTAWPGCFLFQLPNDPNGYEVEALRPFTYLVPWATEADAAAPN